MARRAPRRMAVSALCAASLCLLAAALLAPVAAGEDLPPPAVLKRIFRNGHPGAKILQLRTSGLLRGTWEGVIYRPRGSHGLSRVDLAVYRGRRPVRKPRAEVVYGLSPTPVWQLEVKANVGWTGTYTELHEAVTSFGAEDVEETTPAWSRTETTTGDLSWSWTGTPEPLLLGSSDGLGLGGEVRAEGEAITRVSQSNDPSKAASCSYPIRLRDEGGDGGYEPRGKLTARGRRERFVIEDYEVSTGVRGEEPEGCGLVFAGNPGAPGNRYAFLYFDVTVPQAPWTSPVTVPIHKTYRESRGSAENRIDAALQVDGTARLRLVGFR